MRDDVTFEARLADALGRYAELAPTMDDAEIARQAIAAGQPARRIGWPAFLPRGRFDGSTTGRPATRVAYLLVVLALILAAILLAVAAGAFRNDSILPVAGNGTIAFTVQGNDHAPAGTRLMNPTYGGTAGIQYDPCYHLACDTFAGTGSGAGATAPGRGLIGLDQMSDAEAHAVLTLVRTKVDLRQTTASPAARTFGSLVRASPGPKKPLNR